MPPKKHDDQGRITYEYFIWKGRKLVAEKEHLNMRWVMKRVSEISAEQRELYRLGAEDLKLTQSAIAAEMGVSRQAIHQLLKQSDKARRANQLAPMLTGGHVHTAKQHDSEASNDADADADAESSSDEVWKQAADEWMMDDRKTR